LQKLTVSMTSQNGTSPILMWKVNQPLLWEHVLDEMYHGALNLKLRMAFEEEKDEEVSISNTDDV